MKHKIALLTGDMTKSGGTERAASNLANILVNSGHEVHIVSMYAGVDSKSHFDLDERVRLYNLGIPYSHFLIRSVNYLKYIRLVRRYCRSNGIDVMMGTTHAFNMLMRFLGGGMKKAACEHMNYQAVKSVIIPLRKIMYSGLDAVVVLTEGDAGNYYPFMGRDRVFVIPNSLPFENDTPAELKEKRILAVGRLTHPKNFETLIEASVILKSELPDWRVDIFGDGEDKAKLLRMITDGGGGM